MSAVEKLVLVTRKTRLELLLERFNTRAQAKFALEHAGLDFDDYAREHDTFRRSLDQVRAALEMQVPLQVIDRALAPTYLFAPTDVVVVLGQDGTVANVAKYVGDCPLLGVNPDPERFDGVLLPFRVDEVRRALSAVLEGRHARRFVTLAEAHLSDGQRLLAFNDLFLGARTHVSAQYRLSLGDGKPERQSSSGVLVATGAGSTGWLSSVCTMASGLSRVQGGGALGSLQFQADAPRLRFVVREPFVSRVTSAELVTGEVDVATLLRVESLMPSGGVIFSDGMEDDALGFSSGVVAEVGPSAQRAQLVLPHAPAPVGNTLR